MSVWPDATDAPKCTHARTVAIGVAVGEALAVECRVLANPPDVTFEWAMANRTAASKVPLSHSSSGMQSVAKFIANSEHDFGQLQCWARNSVGKQRQPCVFQIIKAGTCRVPHGRDHQTQSDQQLTDRLIAQSHPASRTTAPW